MNAGDWPLGYIVRETSCLLKGCLTEEMSCLICIKELNYRILPSDYSLNVLKRSLRNKSSTVDLSNTPEAHSARQSLGFRTASPETLRFRKG